MKIVSLKFLNWLAIPSMLFVFCVFLKIGFLFFGGGYAVIPIMHRDLVSNLHLLTEKEFIDGIAISQLTPGPIAVLATFAGYCISGVSGAIIATFAMFLPGSILMLFLSESYEKIKNSDRAMQVLNTIVPVIIGLLIAASWLIGRAAIHNYIGLILFFLSFFLLIKYKISPVILILAAAFLGFVFKL